MKIFNEIEFSHKILKCSYRLLDVRTHMDQYMGTGQIACGIVTVVGENEVLCTVNLPGLDQFQIPLLGNFHYHRLQAMPFVEWISINQFGEEQEGLSALTDFIANHHLVPDLTEPLVSISTNHF